MRTRAQRLGLGLDAPTFAHRSPLTYLSKYAAVVPLRDDVASVAHEVRRETAETPPSLPLSLPSLVAVARRGASRRRARARRSAARRFASTRVAAPCFAQILLRSTREYGLLRFEPSLVAATALVIAVRSCQAEQRAQQAQPRRLLERGARTAAKPAGAASEPPPGGTGGGCGAQAPFPPSELDPRDGLPDERALYACTGHSAAEVRQCEGVFARERVVDSPLTCHSIASGQPRTSATKTIRVHLDIRADSAADARLL
jgi:hypothetical protein